MHQRAWRVCVRMLSLAGALAGADQLRGNRRRVRASRAGGLNWWRRSKMYPHPRQHQPRCCTCAPIVGEAEGLLVDCIQGHLGGSREHLGPRHRGHSAWDRERPRVRDPSGTVKSGSLHQLHTWLPFHLHRPRHLSILILCLCFFFFCTSSQYHTLYATRSHACTVDLYMCTC